MAGDWKKQIVGNLNTFFVFMISAIIEAVYISLVVLINVGVDLFVNFLHPTGITYWTFLVTQILLVVLSLYNMVFYVYSDMKIAYFRYKKTISLAQRKIDMEL